MIQASVLPGDVIVSNVKGKQNPIRISKGLQMNSTNVITTLPGDIEKRNNDTILLHATQQTYYPAINDCIVGIIVDRRGADGYVVDINSFRQAFLPTTAFSGATRRNQAAIPIGTAIYARVLQPDVHIDPVLTCTLKDGTAGAFGVQHGGAVFRCDTAFSKSLASPKNTFLPEIGARIPFEIASGENGMVWINSHNPRSILEVWESISAHRT
ncbi:putative Exosome complex component rrp40 [Blattamonas nauphoetae]|uniref:Exosome complex component rrp40 n=1 Tax=Blattamonas nauphoetae TaxID=2049346 RepID=A0ABQ9YFK2_9EUKA|nr:putative Exosome complex component rrp40 [Blattamonas nauphoetae]